MTDAATRVRDFLLLNGGRSYCEECLARVLKLRTVALAKRATSSVAKAAGFRREVTECGRCQRTTLTTMALWQGR
jgi:hypothetical protein